MAPGDTIDCFVHRKGKRVSRDRRAGSHVALIAFGVGITECLPMAACELAQPEPQSVRLLWSARSRGDSAFWRDQWPPEMFWHTKRFRCIQ